MILLSILIALDICCVIVIIKEIFDPIWFDDTFYLKIFSIFFVLMTICIVWVYSTWGIV